MSESIYDQIALTIAELHRLSDAIAEKREQLKHQTYGGRDFMGRRDRIFTRLRAACQDAWAEAHALINDVETFAAEMKG